MGMLQEIGIRRYVGPRSILRYLKMLAWLLLLAQVRFSNLVKQWSLELVQKLFRQRLKLGFLDASILVLRRRAPGGF